MSLLRSSRKNGRSEDATVFAEASQLAQLRLEQYMSDLHLSALPTTDQLGPQEPPIVPPVQDLRLTARPAQDRSQL